MTQITWFARLVTSDGQPAAGVAVQLQAFDLRAGWRGIADATTKADGRVRATVGDAGPAAGPAPMLRLMEVDAAPAMLGGVPNVTATGTPPALTCDFGEIVYIPDRFTVLRAAPARMAMASADVAGIAVPASAARMAVGTAIGGGALNQAAVVGTTDLQSRLAAREADLTRAQTERDDARTQLATRTADLQKLQADLDTRTATVKAAQAERDDARTQLATRTADVQKLQADLDTRTAAIKAVQAERDDSKAQLAARTADVKRLEAENAAIRAQVDTGGTTIRGIQAERDDARAQLAQRETDLRTLQLERDNIRTQLTDSEKRLAEIRTAGTATGAATIEGTSAKVSVGVFATRLGGEIDSAQTALKDRGFSLGTISVTARALVDDGGAQISFPGAEAMKAIPPAALSDIAIQYHPSPATDAAGTGVQVPDVRQLTESAARRVLASVGLGLEVTQGPLAIDRTCAEGQVMLQSPRAGERTPRGTKVIAIFASGQG